MRHVVRSKSETVPEGEAVGKSQTGAMLRHVLEEDAIQEAQVR